MDDSLKIIKWYFTIAFILVVGLIIGGIADNYYTHLETEQAMKNDYIQQVDPTTHKLIWIKENSNE